MRTVVTINNFHSSNCPHRRSTAGDNETQLRTRDVTVEKSIYNEEVKSIKFIYLNASAEDNFYFYLMIINNKGRLRSIPCRVQWLMHRELLTTGMRMKIILLIIMYFLQVGVGTNCRCLIFHIVVKANRPASTSNLHVGHFYCSAISINSSPTHQLPLPACWNKWRPILGACLI